MKYNTERKLNRIYNKFDNFVDKVVLLPFNVWEKYKRNKRNAGKTYNNNYLNVPDTCFKVKMSKSKLLTIK